MGNSNSSESPHISDALPDKIGKLSFGESSLILGVLFAFVYELGPNSFLP